MAHVVECYVKSSKVDEERTLVSVSDFHLGFYNNRCVGFENFENLVMALEKVSFDYLMVPGDMVNDVGDLENDLFCDYFVRAMKELSQGKLSFFTYGNHELMTMGEDGWQAANPSRLNDVLSDLSNVVLLDGLNHFSLRDESLLERGFPMANINIIGASMPFEHYERDKEEDLSFFKYLNRARMFGAKRYVEPESYNILMLHVLQNFIKLSRASGESFVPGIDFAVGGHYHNGMIPNWLSSAIPGNSGLLSPQMEYFPEDVRGIEEVAGVLVHMGGFTNFRVESPLLNKLAGEPYIFVLHVQPLGKKIQFLKTENKNILVKTKRYHL